MLAPIFLFLMGFLFGLVFCVLMDHQFRVTMAVVLWLPIVVLLLLQYTEVIEPGTLGTIFVFIPRAIKLPLLGILVGFGLLALLTASRREVR
jgi:uncharacterized membrane protein YgaE (UPF0421/DUF939 family)